jgi:hypothetical protein
MSLVQSSGGTPLVRLLMPALLHRTESKRGPCAAWFLSGRTDIPEIHPEILHGGISKKLRHFIYSLRGCLRASPGRSGYWIFIVRAVRRRRSGYIPTA